MHMRTRPALPILTTLALLVAIPVAAETHTLKIATQAPERSVWGKTLRKMADELERVTNDRLKLKIYAGGVQGDERTVLRKMRVGQVHGATLIGPGQSAVCPDSSLLRTPLLFSNEGEVEHVLEKVKPDLVAQSRKKGFEIVGWPQLGFSYVFSQNPVDSVDTFRDSRPWIIEDDTFSKHLFTELGVNPVSAGVGDVLAALQSGLIRAVVTPPVGLISLQWHTRVAYRSDVEISFSVGVLAIRSASWDRLPEDLQKKFREVVERHVTELNRTIRRQNAEALAVLERAGMKIAKVDEESRRRFTAATRKVRDDLAGKSFSKEILERVRGILEAYRRDPRTG